MNISASSNYATVSMPGPVETLRDSRGDRFASGLEKVAQTLGLDPGRVQAAFDQAGTPASPSSPQDAVRAVAEKLGLEPAQVKSAVAEAFQGPGKQDREKAAPGAGGKAFAKVAEILDLKKGALQEAFTAALQQILKGPEKSSETPEPSFLDLVAQNLGIGKDLLSKALQSAGPQVVDLRV